MATKLVSIGLTVFYHLIGFGSDFGFGFSSILNYE